MNQYLQEHDARKEQVIAFLDKSIEQFKGWQQHDQAEALAKLRDNVQKDLFSIVLVGEFSAGKSTFLNALMRRRILPSFTSETTATVNFLCHTSQAPNGETGIVYYRDGHTETLPDLDPSTIEKVVSTRGDNEDASIAERVDHVDLFLDSEFLQDGVMLVDSPGLNGVADHHREITEKQIKASHASIFMFSADHPGSKTDFEYLRELKSQSNNIFFVLNKIDVLRRDEDQTPESVVEYLRNSYRKKFPDESSLPKIWPVAGYPALAARDGSITEYRGQPITSAQQRQQLEVLSKMDAFEERLWQYLTKGERTHDQLCTPVQNTIKALSIQKQQFENKVRLLEAQAGSEELEKQHADLEVRIAQLKSERNKTSADVRARVGSALQHLRESLAAQCSNIEKNIASRLDDCETAEDIRDFAEGLPTELQRKYSLLASRLDDEMREELLIAVKDAYDQYFDELDERFAQLSEQPAITIDRMEMDLSDFTSHIDLDKFDRECAALRDEIKNFENDVMQLGRKAGKARRIEAEITERKQRIRSLQDARQILEDNFIAPPVAYREEQYTDRVRRGGLFGAIGWVLFGGKPVTKTRQVQDTTDRDEAIQRMEERLARRDQEIKSQKEELAALGTLEAGSEEYEFEKEIAERKLDSLTQELAQKQENFVKALEKDAAKARRRLNRDVQEILGSYDQEIQNDLGKYLREQNQRYIRVVQELVNTNLDNELQKMNRRLEDLMNTINAEGAERDRQLAEARDGLAAIKDMLNTGAELEGELETLLQDHVEQEAFEQ